MRVRSLVLVLLLGACGDARVGPDARINPDAAVATCTPSTGTNLSLVPVAQGLSSPVFLTAPAGDTRLFVVEQPGRIRVVKDGALLTTPFLDLRDLVYDVGNEQGLLGLAFHPDYAANGRLFVYYTAESPQGSIVIAEYLVSADDPDLGDPASERRLLVIPHPGHANHNGGGIAFGPDGYLRFGAGDGGGGGDPDGNGQDTSAMLGKLHRIDVDSGDPYAIPPSNPFADSANGPTDPRPEIWAYGLRNPWRWSFDRQTGDLYIGDVGQGDVEEIDVEAADDPGGRNYGWNVVEGNCCYPHGASCSTACDMTGMTAPVVTYTHDGGRCSVTGGYVYRGSCFPDLDGLYFFGDYCSNQVWTIAWPGDTTPTDVSADLGSTAALAGLTSFGQDALGELYVLSRDGDVFRIEAGN